MKNTFFLQGETQGVQAQLVKVTDLFADVDGAMATDYAVLCQAVGELEWVMDMVFAAMEEGKKFAFTHRSKEAKKLVCDVMDSLLESEVNTFVETLVREQSLARIESTPLAPEVVETVMGLYEMRVGRPATEVSKSEVQIQNKEENVQMVKFAGVQGNAQEVLAMQAAKGLVVGNMVTTAVGHGVLQGFEVTKSGIFAEVLVDDGMRKFMANKIKGGIHEIEVKQPAAQSANAQTAPWETDARSAVDKAIEDGSFDNMSEEEKFNLMEEARLAGQQAWKQEQRKGSTQAANSDAAARILAMANNKLGGGGAQQQAPAQNNNNGSSVRVPGAQVPARNQNQNNGGNVQMENNKQTRGAQVQDRPARGVAGGTQGQSTRIGQQARQQQPSTGRPAAGNQATQSSAPVSTGRGGNAGRATGGSAPARSTGVSTGRGGSVRIGAGAPVVNQRKGLALKAHTPVVNGRTGAGQPWFMNEERYPKAISGEAFEEVRENADLGISHAIFWTPEAYNARFNRDAQENELAVLQVFFGEVETNEFGRVTAGVSLEFPLRYSNNPDAKSPFYCTAISFFEGKNGRQGTWEYTLNQRDARYAVVVEENYVVRMATENDPKEAVQHIGGGYSNKRIFGLQVSEEVIAQVMRWAQFGWECMTEGSAE